VLNVDEGFSTKDFQLDAAPVELGLGHEKPVELGLGHEKPVELGLGHEKTSAMDEVVEVAVGKPGVAALETVMATRS
jgi:hypothetical protein